jgi:fatty acid desaturase
MQTTVNTARAADDPSEDRAERLRAFGDELDAIHARAQARVGDEDVRRVHRLRRLSRAMEIAGRALLHFSAGPVTFGFGVVALWIHKQLEATEIGHTALHGAYDGLAGAEAFQSRSFSWRVPIDEESWRKGHNVRHHGNTNVGGRDPDIHFGPVRLTEQTPWSPKNRYQAWYAALGLFPNFGFVMNLHFTGVTDLLQDNGRIERLDVLPDRTWKSAKGALQKAFRKYAPYYAYEYVLFPALAGPLFWKVLLGNWLSELMRDAYSAATIFCGHVGHDVKSWPREHKARHRGEWYAMQVESSNDFEVSEPISILCGGLDRQIEHHLFPRLPPQRLREIAPEVRAACARHGVAYKTGTWGQMLKKAFAWIHALSKEEPDPMRAILREMA